MDWPVGYNFLMSTRYLAGAILLVPALLLGQLRSNSVTVTVTQAATAPAAQSSFNVAVTSGLAKSLNDVAGTLSGVGITAANLTSLITLNSQIGNAQSQSLLWTFALTVPFSKQSQVTSSLTALQGTIGQNNSGLTLAFSVTGTQPPTSSSQTCDFAALAATARTQAQTLASAAGLSPGTVVGIASAVPSTMAPCSLTMSFSLGSAPWQATLNTMTITASQTNTPQADQATVTLTVTSGLTTGLDDVTGALQGAGITGANFSNVTTSTSFLLSGGLAWSFTLTVPLSKLNSMLTQITTAQQTIQQQNSGLGLQFSVGGLSSSQAQQPATCPGTSLVAEAQTQAQQIATAAAVQLGPIVAMSESQTPTGSVGGMLSAVLSPVPTAGFLLGYTGGVVPFANSASVCSVVVQFQLLY